MSLLCSAQNTPTRHDGLGGAEGGAISSSNGANNGAQSSGNNGSHRILVRTCNGLELRDPPYMPADQGGVYPHPPPPPSGHKGYAHCNSVGPQPYLQKSSSVDFVSGVDSPLLDDEEDDLNFPPFSSSGGAHHGSHPPRAKSSMSHHSHQSHHSFRSMRANFADGYNG